MSSTFGDQPGDVVTSSRGDVLEGVSLSLYPTRVDAVAQTNLLGAVVTDLLGRWSYTHATLMVVWVRTLDGQVYAVEDPTAVPNMDAAKADKTDLPVNVKDFGAVGNGTTDDTAAIQAAINSLPLNTASVGILSPLGFANGGAIFIPRGRYKITSTITLQRGIHIYGESRESSQVLSFTAGSVFQYLDAGRFVQDEIVIENLSIWQDTSIVATSGAGVEINFGPAATQSTNVICRNMLVMNTYRGFLLAAGIWSSFDNCDVGSVITNGFEISYTDGTNSVPSTSTTFKNCYASSSGGAGYYIDRSDYISFVGCASDSNGTYGYHFNSGTTCSLMSCGAEENTLAGAYLFGTGGAVINLEVIHTTAGVKHGIILEAADATTILGGKYAATTATGYGIHVVTSAGPITCIGTQFTGNYVAAICDSTSKFLHLTGANGLVGSTNHWAIGTDATPDLTATFQVGGTASSSTGLKANGTFVAAPSGRNVATQVLAQTANTAVTYPELYGLQVLNAVKGAASSIARTVGVNVDEQTIGTSANANMYLAVGAALPAGNWSVYSASTRDSVFVGPLRSGSGTGPKWSSGTGIPEGVVTAPVGSLFSRTDGGALTSLYVKETGVGNTGWVAK